jgi:SAM-dependent methyltransferase
MMTNIEGHESLAHRVRRTVGAALYVFEQGFAKVTGRHDWLLRRNFNRWARWGWGKQMERDHASITENMLSRLRFDVDERVLDLGCGDGWTVRRIASVAGATARVVGVDVSDEMVTLAKTQSAAIPNAEFRVASAESLPFEENRFTKVVSVEAFYFCNDQDRVLKELLRVTTPGGNLAILMCIFKGHPDVNEWTSELRVPVHVRSGEEYKEMLRNAGWTNAEAEVFTPPSVTPQRGISHGMALLITAQKP